LRFKLQLPWPEVRGLGTSMESALMEDTSLQATAQVVGHGANPVESTQV